MNILHIISQHPESTGSGIYLQNLMRQAAAAGHGNYLVAGVSGDRLPRLEGIEPESCRLVRFSGKDLDFTIPGMSDVMPYPSSRFRELTSESILTYERTFAETIGEAARDFPIDIIHSHHLWLASAVSRRVLPDFPLVTSCHSTDLRQFVRCSHLRDRVLEDCRAIDLILALSSHQAEKIHSLYGVDRKKIEVVGAGFADDLFYLGKKPESPPVHLLYAGKLSQAKGVDWLLRVYEGLAGLPIHLHLAGSGHGKEARHIRELANQSGHRITVHGALSQQNLAGLMRRCHIFILPSFYEGLPLVLLEALASGCRIVTTNLPGCLEVLDTVAADLVELVNLPAMRAIDRPDDADWKKLDRALATALHTMIERVVQTPSPPPHTVEASTARSSWQMVFRKIVELYARVRRGPGAG